MRIFQCPKCGILRRIKNTKKLPDGTFVCPECGEKVKKVPLEIKEHEGSSTTDSYD